jgi:hypothetical protein
MKPRAANAFVLASVLTLAPVATAAEVKPGDVVTPDNWSKVVELLSPGNLMLVRQGMVIRVVPPGRIDWPPMYKLATEQYASQVRLNLAG